MYYFRLQRKLKQLLNFTKFIPELRRAGDELMYMEDPPPEVHITMGALFLLLEEPDRAIEVCVCFMECRTNQTKMGPYDHPGKTRKDMSKLA